MSVPQLPLIPQLNVILSLTPKQLLNYCRVSHEAYYVCSLPEYVIPYFKHYGFKPEEIPGDTFEKKLGFLADFNWEWVPGANFPEKGIFIRETIDAANKFIKAPLTQIQEPNTRPYYISLPFRDILTLAVRTGNPRFVKYIFNIMTQKIDSAFFHEYFHSFRQPFYYAVVYAYTNPPTDPWYQIIDFLTGYYSPLGDPILIRIYNRFIEIGDLDMVMAFSIIFPPDEKSFWVAVNSGNLEMAQYFRESLLAKGGSDPILNIGRFQHLYYRAIEDHNLSLVEVLSTFVKPNQNLVRFADNRGAHDIANFLSTQL